MAASVRRGEASRAMALHRQKIHSMHSQIDTRPPASMALAHMRRNLKQEKLVEDRWQEIERSNHILVRRMREIMNGDGKYQPLVSNGAKHSSYRPISLNYRVRKAREVQIQTENRAIIRRLCASKSTYAKEDMRPCNFQPHFLPKLPLSKLGSVAADSRSQMTGAGSRASVRTQDGDNASSVASLAVSSRAQGIPRAGCGSHSSFKRLKAQATDALIPPRDPRLRWPVPRRVLEISSWQVVRCKL